MWDLIVSVPDHCLSFYFVFTIHKYYLLRALSPNSLHHLPQPHSPTHSQNIFSGRASFSRNSGSLYNLRCTVFFDSYDLVWCGNMPRNPNHYNDTAVKLSGYILAMATVCAAESLMVVLGYRYFLAC